MSEDDRYEVLEKIGHGSFGVIRKVRRKADGQILCRKEISYQRMSQKEREQLQAELSILKELRHPNIVAYYEREHLKASQDLHLYMEYCGNGDLGRVIKNLKAKNLYADEEFVWSVFSQLVTALYRCHNGENPPEAGPLVMGLGNHAHPEKAKQQQFMILHRDLKPENVFLDADNSVRLGDFGLSKILQSHDFASTYVGTPFYMSPELCAGEMYTLYSDIWSLGCIIYELCAKEPPFNAKTHMDLVHKIKSGRTAPLPSVYSAELQKVVTSCLRVNPNMRPDTAQLLNLPVVKLMRKEQEVVTLGQQLRKEKELVSKSLKDLNDKTIRLESERESMRVEIDAMLRREWEVKARLEIDRQVAMELDRLRRTFDTEVDRRVSETVEVERRRVSSLSIENYGPIVEEDPSRPSAPVAEGHLAHVSTSTSGEPSDFPSATDISSLSIESPKANDKLLKRSHRTPFARAQTTYVASPMDVQMADPSPMSIASLSLSPRRNGSGSQKNATQPRPARNIFVAAATGGIAGKEKWEPTNASSFPSPEPRSPSSDIDGVDDDDDDGFPVVPSPTRAKSNCGNDPFKALAPGRRPGVLRQKTAPAQRFASAPNFGAPLSSKPQSRPPTNTPAPARSPSRRKSKLPGANEKGSPTKKPGSRELPYANCNKEDKNSGLKSKKGNEDMFRAALRNNIQGRTLVELAQGRAADKHVDNDGIVMVKGITDKDEVAVWDPEVDEMPSPFLVRGAKGVRA
ncbi:kinase-like domain-containing protein [Lineolata rhizophorae]|uniref:non-specific serine/threonine protein kinase n=1 Tax=Lineolata rhizophorae TaxID=578093 RepID=A0A6A6NSA3_9PEZI|nr:kinase-like domain-containing protein [Lineolata rhizophorae]